MKEIEYKFLVNESIWAEVEKPNPEPITQGYLSKDTNSTVRIRTKGSKGFFTIKSKTIGHTRDEFEYEIPFDDAKTILSTLINKKIEKQRYTIDYNGKTWEIDEFQGKLAGLILAEIELKSEDEQFDLPPWVTIDVSEDPNYFNSALSEKC